MKRYIHAKRLIDAMLAEGLVPENCSSVKVVIAPDHALRIRYEVFVSEDDIPKVMRALATFANETKP